MIATASPASFRDPSGYVFRRDGVFYRQVNQAYRDEYDLLMSSGLYDDLVRAGRLIPHEELDDRHEPLSEVVYKIIRPQQVPLISYPYEWSFSQLRDAAMLTLDVQATAIDKGMSLKDASAYNVQFHDGRPVLIDTLSFERYQEGKPWVAYKQFCQHFLAPLALMSRTDVRLNQLLRVYIDGIPLDLASKLLPKRTKFTLAMGVHIHAHAKVQQRYADQPNAASAKVQSRQFSKRSFLTILQSLRQAVQKMTWRTGKTEWADYYESNNNYGAEGLGKKGQALRQLIARVNPQTVWDLGGNTGVFSRIAGENGASVVTWDIDPNCVEFNYRQVREKGERNILPLLLDLTNPSPGIGWANAERDSIAERGPVDLVMALGLIHHLAISNNVPLVRVAEYFSRLGRSLIIEFVPKADSQVQKLLATRADIFGNYDRDGFESAFGKYFSIQQSIDIEGTVRTLYLMKTAREPDPS